MTANRALRRKMRAEAKPAAALMAARCYDFRDGSDLVPVGAPMAVAALTRAFTLLLRNGGKPVAVPIAMAEAQAFPRWYNHAVPGGVTWLAVGMDHDGRASYALQTASSPVLAYAHDAARERALHDLALVCATSGFPAAKSRGQA